MSKHEAQRQRLTARVPHLPESSRRRGWAGQLPRRALERRVRRRVLAFRRWALRRGVSGPEIAAHLGIAHRTLQRWAAAWRRHRLRATARGRPVRRSPLAQRRHLLGLLQLLGPQTGVPTLQALCRGMARREIRDVLRRYRRVWKHRRLPHVLRWHRPGTVWAADFAEAPLPVDGVYPCLFAVRDLASGEQLLWLPVEDESAQTATDALTSLFRQYGPPLVLKTDNGSAFKAGEMSALLSRWSVAQLRSPAHCPSFNGSCEAGIGSMKTRTHHQSARRGYPGEWTCDDTEAAREQANETARPWGAAGPTPGQRWEERLPISAAERAAFGQAVAGEVQGRDGQTLRRAAISRALVARSLLTIA